MPIMVITEKSRQPPTTDRDFTGSKLCHIINPVVTVLEKPKVGSYVHVHVKYLIATLD